MKLINLPNFFQWTTTVHLKQKHNDFWWEDFVGYYTMFSIINTCIEPGQFFYAVLVNLLFRLDIDIDQFKKIWMELHHPDNLLPYLAWTGRGL
jgi:hypothetical protein